MSEMEKRSEMCEGENREEIGNMITNHIQLQEIFKTLIESGNQSSPEDTELRSVYEQIAPDLIAYSDKLNRSHETFRLKIKKKVENKVKKTFKLFQSKVSKREKKTHAFLSIYLVYIWLSVTSLEGAKWKQSLIRN